MNKSLRIHLPEAGIGGWRLPRRPKSAGRRVIYLIYLPAWRGGGGSILRTCRPPVDHLSPMCHPVGPPVCAQSTPTPATGVLRVPPTVQPNASHGSPTRSICFAQCTLRRATRRRPRRQRLSYEIMGNRGKLKKNRTRSKGAGVLLNSWVAGFSGILIVLL